MKLLLIAISGATLYGSDCIAVSGNTIFARDIAAAVPLFQSINPGTAIGFAPSPGVERILSARELVAIARQQGLEVQPGSVVPGICVERATQPIEATELSKALIAALQIPDAHLTIVDFSKEPVPPGRMEFSLSGLGRPPENAPAAPVIWRGRLVYGGERSLSIWAKVSLTLERPGLMAAEQIAAGSIVRDEQLVVKSTPQFPLSISPLDSIPQASGRVARRTIPAGQVIPASALEAFQDVARGQTVQVEVIDGRARLSLEAIAETAGCKGDSVTLRNSTSGRTFRGIVEGKGKVIVRPSSEDQS